MVNWGASVYKILLFLTYIVKAKVKKKAKLVYTNELVVSILTCSSTNINSPLYLTYSCKHAQMLTAVLQHIEK